MKRGLFKLCGEVRGLRFRIGNNGHRAGTDLDPEGPAPITAKPPHLPRHAPGSGHDDGPFAAFGAIFAVHAITGSGRQDPAKGAMPVVRDLHDAHARPATVCGP